MARLDSTNEILDKKIGTYWFRKFVQECKKLSPHLHFRKIKYGFYRIYWVGGDGSAYIGEAFKEMPQFGYELEDYDMRNDEKKYRQEYEDQGELPRKIKNFVEGYHENLDHIKTRVYMMRNDAEFRKNAYQAYKGFVVK
jgi:hypothetical protein